MHLFLTGVLPFLAHDHASGVAFLTCRHHNFHSSIIPEFLSNEERVKSFCETRQQNEFDTVEETQYTKLYNLFVQTPLMQFSPSLVLQHGYSVEPIIRSLLETKYFTRSLRRCSFQRLSKHRAVQQRFVYSILRHDLLHLLSKVQSLTSLDLGKFQVDNEHLQILVNSCLRLETLTIQNAVQLKIVDQNTAIKVISPPPPSTKTLINLTMEQVEPSFATQFIVPIFSNLRTLTLNHHSTFGSFSEEELDLLPLSSSLPLLTHMSLGNFRLKNTESLNNLVDLSSLHFGECDMPDLSFLTQENTNLPQLTTLSLDRCNGFSTDSFASLAHAPHLHTFKFVSYPIPTAKFTGSCLQYLENMVHLRKLDLCSRFVFGDSQLFKTLIQNLFQLEELNLSMCDIGDRDAITGTIYNSRLRVLNLSFCNLVDDDLDGIGALKNTLEVLVLEDNLLLTNKGLRLICKDLDLKLKVLDLSGCTGIDDLSPLKDCSNLEDLDVSNCRSLINDSFKVFSEEPNSFPSLRVLKLSKCDKLTEKVFEHLANNNNLVYQLTELGVGEKLIKTLLSSPTARSLYQLRGLRRLTDISIFYLAANRMIQDELMRNMKNLR